MKMTTLTINDGDGALSPVVWSCVPSAAFSFVWLVYVAAQDVDRGTILRGWVPSVI